MTAALKETIKLNNGYVVEVFEDSGNMKEPFGLIITPPEGIGTTETLTATTEQTVEHLVKDYARRVPIALPESEKALFSLMVILNGCAESFSRAGEAFVLTKHVRCGQFQYLSFKSICGEEIFVTKTLVCVVGSDLPEFDGELVSWFWKLADMLNDKDEVAA